MGLCDEERMAKLFFSMKRLNKLLEKWNGDHRTSRDYPSYNHLKSLADQSFPIFFANQSNAIHWFMGSSTSNIIRSDMEADSWGLAIGTHLSKALDENAGFWDRKPGDPWRIEDSFSVEQLLEYAGHVNESYVFQIYQEMENSIYALRRYDDKFRKDLGKLDDLIGKICGACFSIFSDHECFANAYLINRIIHLIYTGDYPYKKDSLTEIMEGGLGFALNMKRPLKELADTHIRLVKASELKTLDLKQRFLETVGMIRRKECLTSFLTKAEEVPELKPFMAEAKEIADKLVEEKSHSYERKSELEVYGNYDITRDLDNAKKAEKIDVEELRALAKKTPKTKTKKAVKPAKKKAKK